jgi:hypothetical protein
MESLERFNPMEDSILMIANDRLGPRVLFGRIPGQTLAPAPGIRFLVQTTILVLGIAISRGNGHRIYNNG